jgi:hypothetical protein
VWGTTVLVTDNLTPGRSLKIGEGEGAVVASPTARRSPSTDPRGRHGLGARHARRDRRRSATARPQRRSADLGRVGAPIPIVAGDYG